MAIPNNDTDNDRKAWLLAWALVLLLVHGHTARPLSPVQRKRARTLLRSHYERRSERLAQGVTSGAIAVAAWQAEMTTSIEDYARQMAIAGAGTLVKSATQAAVEAKLAEQQPFLSRFAGVLGSLSLGAIAARAKLYGGSAWGSYFLGQAQDAGFGIVDRWVTRDDKFVCANCAPRHGRYFLPSESPYPGWDCLGSCRCERVSVYAPDVYTKMTGRRAA